MYLIQQMAIQSNQIIVVIIAVIIMCLLTSVNATKAAKAAKANYTQFDILVSNSYLYKYTTNTTNITGITDITDMTNDYDIKPIIIFLRIFNFM